MCMGWCPLAAEWGNWAEWAGAFAAAVVGYFVWRVSVETNELAAKTHELARAGSETTAALARLEEKRVADEAALRSSEQKLLMISLAPMLSLPISVLSKISEYLKHDQTFDRLILSTGDLEKIIEDLANAADNLQLHESTRSRLHCLEISVAGRVVRLEATMRYFHGLFRALSREVRNNSADDLALVKELIGHTLTDSRELRGMALKVARDSGMPMPRAPDSGS